QLYGTGSHNGQTVVKKLNARKGVPFEAASDDRMIPPVGRGLVRVVPLAQEKLSLRVEDFDQIKVESFQRPIQSGIQLRRIAGKTGGIDGVDHERILRQQSDVVGFFRLR